MLSTFTPSFTADSAKRRSYSCFSPPRVLLFSNTSQALGIPRSLSPENNRTVTTENQSNVCGTQRACINCNSSTSTQPGDAFNAMVTVMRPLPLPSIGMSEVLEGAWLVQLMVRVRPISAYRDRHWGDPCSAFSALEFLGDERLSKQTSMNVWQITYMTMKRKRVKMWR